LRNHPQTNPHRGKIQHGKKTDQQKKNTERAPFSPSRDWSL
jgi:hypothetical protein